MVTLLLMLTPKMMMMTERCEGLDCNHNQNRGMRTREEIRLDAEKAKKKEELENDGCRKEKDDKKNQDENQEEEVHERDDEEEEDSEEEDENSNTQAG